MRLLTIVFVIASGTMTGCGQVTPADAVKRSPSASGPFETRPAGKLLYIANAATPSITEYALHARGNAAPLREISGSLTEMGNGLGGIAVDGTGTTYVSSVDGGILEYAANANGNVAPIRKITEATSGPINGFELAVDSMNDLYVANYGDVKVFAPGANGVATPLRDIGGPATMIDSVEGVAVDRAGRLYAVDFNKASVLIFAAGANGNARPIATISGNKTTLAFPRFIGVSPGGDIYVTDEDRVQVFGAGASGNVAPNRVLTFTGSAFPYGNVAVSHHHAFLGASQGGTGWDVDIYRAGVHGSSNPLAVIVGSKTELNEPVGVAIP